MKNVIPYILFIASIILPAINCHAQVGTAINATGNPADPSAMLDVKSTSSGILIPRMTQLQKLAISSPANGLLIYQTDNTSGFWYYNGSAWVQAIGPAGPTGSNGANGTTGAIGPTGANGINGATGAIGPTGAVGSIGTTGVTGQASTVPGPTGPSGSAGNIPSGCILMWSGTLASIPTGWVLCDGTNSTPDLRNKFIMGDSVYTATYHDISGGENYYTLTVAQLPAHNHTINDPGHSHNVAIQQGSYGYYSQQSMGSGGTIQTSTSTTGITINNTGGNAAIDNRPAFFKLAFIMKL